MNTEAIVYTMKARCRDCYRCVRVCPVKAVRMRDGQATVDEARCIACGTCIRECPQKAKAYRQDAAAVERLLAGPAPVAASLAPSFAAEFDPPVRLRLVGALRRLGFARVAETAVGAGPVACKNLEFARPGAASGPVLGTACPAVVAYVRRFYPALTENLAPVASPMVAHARLLRARLGGDWRVVFIGPCVAKKMECGWPETGGAVDAALTFAELRAWLERRGLDLLQCEESGFDEQPAGPARLFPLPGGLLRAGGFAPDPLAPDVLPVSGMQALDEALRELQARPRAVFLEPLMCAEGCVGGPGFACDRNRFERRGAILDYALAPRAAQPPAPAGPVQADLLRVQYAPQPPAGAGPFTEDQIRAVLEGTGKAAPDQQLNCGACGYDTCRDKAVAVLQGMAEIEMCVPMMRRLAEQRTDRIIATSPNGILILDAQLHILSMNPAFRRFFQCTDAVLGRPVAYLMDPEPFEKLTAGALDRSERTVEYASYHLVCHELVYALREENQYVGIFVNLTHLRDREHRLAELRGQTVSQARQLLEHQVEAAQNLAVLLGETTARGEALIQKLLELADESHDPLPPR